jgi:filamentous hemagglutinin family protein
MGYLTFLGLITGKPALAQVSSDGTLSTSIASPDGRNFTINGGDRAGGNLFHSFRDFSVPTGGSAAFNNATDVQNIFGRVTGGNISNIDGLIRANGTANLFLLNPNGILFGSHAVLNIGGSFVGTTANKIQFADGIEFGTVNTAGTPLLTMSVPMGLQMGTDAGTIQVQGNGNDGIVPTQNLGLVSRPGNTIALIGGDVTFTGGVITAPLGRIEIGAVTSGTVSLTPSAAGWQLGYAQAQTFGDVNLTNRSSLWTPDPVGNPAGGIQVMGRDIILNQSQIAAATSGSRQGGAIFVNAQRSLSLSGVHPNAAAPSAWIVNQVAQGAAGNSGNINIQAGTLSLRDGAAIETLSLGAGAAGNVQVKADTISANGAVLVNSPLLLGGSSASRISSTTYQSGAGGNVNVVARQITLTDSANLSTFVLPGATGRGGNVVVEVADDITANGISPVTAITSGIAAYTLGIGDGGHVNVSTDTLHLIDGGWLLAFGSRLPGVPGTGIGNIGDVTVVARRSIEESGAAPASPTVTSFLGSSTAGAGRSGNVTITTPRLDLNSGATIGSSTLPIVGTFGDITQVNNLGDGGNVTINVSDRLTVTGMNPFTLGSSTIATSSSSNGQAGRLAIQTDHLVLRDGGAITTFTTATGNAGELNIRANDILIEGSNGRLPSGIAATAPILPPTTRQFYGLPDFPVGNTGQLSILTDRLTVRDGGVITVKHQGSGNAGQLSIRANQISLNQGQVTATTVAGEGGDIALYSQGIQLNRGSEIAATAGGNGNGGNIHLQVDRDLQLKADSVISASALDQGNGGRIVVTVGELLDLDHSHISTQATGAGNAGTLQLRVGELNLNRGQIQVESQGTGDAGRLTIDADSAQLNHHSLINASTQVGRGGDVQLQMRDTLQLNDQSRIVADAQRSGRGGNVSITAADTVLRDRSRISTNAQGRATGGTLGITGDRLSLFNGSQITASTAGSGEAGSLNIQANDAITLSGSNTRLAAASTTNAAAGSIRLQSPQVNLSDRAAISVSGQGRGGAGNLSIQANTIDLNQQSNLEAEVAGGDRGNITLAAHALLLRNRSTITTNATGRASGGNIQFNGTFLIGLNNSDIVARAQAGTGGNIDITANSVLGIAPRSTLTPDSDINASSQLGLNGSVNITNVNVKPESGLAELPETVVDASQQVAATCAATQASRFIATGRGGIPENPTQELGSDRPWQDLRDLSNFTASAVAAVPTADPASPVEAANWRLNAQGQVELVATSESGHLGNTMPTTCSPPPIQ